MTKRLSKVKIILFHSLGTLMEVSKLSISGIEEKVEGAYYEE